MRLPPPCPGFGSPRRGCKLGHWAVTCLEHFIVKPEKIELSQEISALSRHPTPDPPLFSCPLRGSLGRVILSVHSPGASCFASCASPTDPRSDPRFCARAVSVPPLRRVLPSGSPLFFPLDQVTGKTSARLLGRGALFPTLCFSLLFMRGY